MAARRRLVARQAGLRRLWIVFGLTVVTSVVLAGIAVVRSELLDVEQIVVEGAEQADSRHIVTASGLQPGQALVGLDPGAAARAVETVPWVAVASVDRSWRGQVRISVTERVPVAALPAGTRFALVDAEGQQLEVVDVRPEGFLAIEGVQVSGVPGQVVSSPASDAVAVARGLSPDVAGQTTRIVVDDDDVALDLAVGGRANLGDDEQLEAKMVALETMLTRVDLSCLDTIDVRVPSSPTVRRTGPSSATQVALSENGGC